MTRQGRFLIAGEAQGRALVLREALSFWGGVDIATGAIVDRSHPECGAVVAQRVLVMPSGRGSSSSSSVLAEMLRLGTAPAAFVLARSDAILVVGALVAQSLYGLTCPIAISTIEDIATGNLIDIQIADSGEARLKIGE
jgi:uncharacterized protein